MGQSVAGRTIVITGAARGIGAELARQAAARGARVVAVGLEPDRLRALAQEIDGDWFECDVTDSAALEAAAAHAAERTGRIDVVVANAGIASLGTIAGGDVAAHARTIEVNLIGVLRTVSATMPYLRESRGHALLVSSLASVVAGPGLGPYAAAKAGVEHLAGVLRVEVAADGVTVGTAHPSWVDTDLVRGTRDALPGARESLGRLPWPLRRTVSVPECAATLLGAIERRARRVHVPHSVWLVRLGAPLLRGRWGDRLLLAGYGPSGVKRMDEDVRALGRPFGEHSTAFGGQGDHAQL